VKGETNKKIAGGETQSTVYNLDHCGGKRPEGSKDVLSWTIL